MDDPISALDSNVKKSIFENLFCGELRGKTRVLVTHAVEFLDQVDRIIVMEKGRIKYIGTYDEIQHSDEIQHILKTLEKTARKNSELEEDKEENKEDKEDVKPDEKLKKSFMSEKGTNITEDENEEKIVVGWKVYYSFFIKNNSWIFYIFFITLSFAGALAIVFNGIFTGRFINPYEEKYSFWSLIFISLSLAIVASIATTIVTTGISLATIKLTRKLHIDMLEKTANAPVNLYFDKTPSGRILNRYSSDINKLDNGIDKKVGWIISCFSMVIFDIVVAALNTPFVLATLPFIIIAMVILLRYYIKSFREVNRLGSVSHSPMMNLLGETINGATTIRSFQKQNDFVKTNYKVLNVVTNVGFWRESLRSWFAIRIEFVSLFLLGFTSGFMLYYRSKADPILIGVLFNRFIMFNMMLLFSCQLLSDLEGDLVSYDRCLKMLEIPQEREQRKYMPELMDWPSQGQIEFEDYSLKYRPDTEVVLKNLNFTIKPKEKIGIVGRTGAGKSTICLALCRIVEAFEGKIKIDGIDVSTLGIADLRERITIIPQDPTLFEGTLRFNLDPVGTIPDVELLRMARKANLEEFINRDDKGLDQKIEDGGKNLSSGEKQLICILRAILRKNKIVLMDEATANIDIKTEQIIQKLIHEEFEDSTVLTIAHRLNTIINSDRVLVLSRGEVQEFDDPQKLLEDQDSMFYSYANELKKHEEE
mmetsp:Transcript_19102/g.18734  ORF Transcript_19102/g.18734 Transcript_19102/m.18734 type:complete len:705 (+) Transcript_19102:2007-4121(+)